MKAKIIVHPHGVEFVAPRGFVRVDTRDHVIKLVTKSGVERTYGALRAALLTSMGVVADELGLPLHGRDLTPVAKAIESALALDSGARNAAVEASIAEIYPTPLIHAAPYLAATWLQKDAARFRACRIAVANAEDARIEEDGPDVAVDVVRRLEKWRDLYAHGGKANRAVNQMLNDFGETLPASALWGLRRIPLTRPRTNAAHLELLGWLGALPPGVDDDAMFKLVEAAGDDEIDAILALDTDETPRSVAAVMAEGDPSSTTALQLVRSGIARLTDAFRDRRGALAAPPSAPPDNPEIRLIRTSDELRAEGDAMHHCVYSRVALCARGAAYIFHVERDGSSATIHVDAGGDIVEARGPFNRASFAVSWGSAVLAQWGLALWSQRYRAETLLWPVGFDAPPGAKPLRSVRAVHDAFVLLATRRHDGHLALRNWFVEATKAALDGRAALVLAEGAHPGVWALRNDGNSAGDTDSLRLDVGARFGETAPPADRAFVRAAPSALMMQPVYAELQRGWRVPPPPIAPPRVQGLRLVVGPGDVARIRAELRVNIDARVDALRAGHTVVFDCRPGRGGVVVEVTPATSAVLVLGHHDVADDEIRWATERVTAWARGLWSVRIGMQRRTWSGAMRAPSTTEPLTTVDACAVLYDQICDLRGDKDGTVAAFFEKHVADAVAGRAWLVVRDRALGSVAVLDSARRIVATLAPA